MARITIQHKKPIIPLPELFLISINGQTLGALRKGKVEIIIPPGTYTLGIKQPILPTKKDISLSAEKEISVDDTKDCNLIFESKEGLWNIIFFIDFVIWIAGLFVTIPSPWDLIIDILSYSFFAAWLIRIYIIHNRYFRIINQ